LITGYQPPDTASLIVFEDISQSSILTIDYVNETAIELLIFYASASELSEQLRTKKWLLSYILIAAGDDDVVLEVLNMNLE
jgi:hypothetical protein